MEIPIDPEGDGKLPDQERFLLQRAFNDCQRISVGIIQSSRGRWVVRVRAQREDKPHPVPFVVKLASKKDIDRETGNIQTACGDHTPFSYFPPIADDRGVSGRTKAALVSHFLDRAILLRDYIRDHSPSVAIASIFDGPLRSWRHVGRTEKVRIGKFALDTGIVNSEPKSYQTAHRHAAAKAYETLHPQDMIMALADGPLVPVWQCGSHGDLHIGNIFIRENSVDVVLIDFNRSGPAPASCDPAELEVSLALKYDARDGDRIPDDLLFELYTPPLLTRDLRLGREAPRRMLAIQQVRLQAAAAASNVEYAVMVASNLLWYAAKGSYLPFVCADRLIRWAYRQ